MTAPDQALKQAEAKGKFLTSPRHFWWRPADILAADVTPLTAIYTALQEILVTKISVVGGPYPVGGASFLFRKMTPSQQSLTSASYSGWTAWSPYVLFTGSVTLTEGQSIALEVTKSIPVILPPLALILELKLPE